MIMSEDAIKELYRKSEDEGDPEGQILSLAKLNNVTADIIRAIVSDETNMPERKKAGRPRKETDNGDQISEPVIRQQGTNAPLAIPEVVRSVLSERLDILERQITVLQKQKEEAEAEYKVIANFIQGRV